MSGVGNGRQAEGKYKIALVLDDSLDTPDGVQQYVLRLGRWLAETGHDVRYLVGHTQRTDVPGLHSLGRNVRVRFNGNRMSIPLPVPRRRLRQLLAAEQFDIIHVQMPYSPMLGARVVAAAGPRTAVVGTFHIAPQSQLVRWSNRALGAVLHRTLKRFDEVVSVSPVAQAFARQTFKLESSVVPNAVDVARFWDARPPAAYAPGLNIVFLGRLVERKGCQHLLAAVRELVRGSGVARPFRVVIAGRGPLEPVLRAYVRDHHLEKYVAFTGFVHEADKPGYLAAADVAVFPSTGGESFGIVLVEAMAAARGAVLAGDNPGYASVLAGHPEALVDPRDAAAFARKLAALLQDPAARHAAHTWQRRLAREFDVHAVGPELLRVYAQALHKRRG